MRHTDHDEKKKIREAVEFFCNRLKNGDFFNSAVADTRRRFGDDIAQKATQHAWDTCLTYQDEQGHIKVSTDYQRLLKEQGQ